MCYSTSIHNAPHLTRFTRFTKEGVQLAVLEARGEQFPATVSCGKVGSKETTGNKLYEGVRGYKAISASEGS